jgi:hypothetical protein
MQTGRARGLAWAYGLFVAVMAGALVWPGPWLVGASPDPLVFGLPPILAWKVGWIVAGLVALLTYHWLAHGKDPS